MKARIFALVLAVVVLVFGAVSAQDGTIVEVAAGNEDFSTLVSLVEAAGLVDTLNGEGPFTVFAPTNEAFAELPGYVVEYLTSEAGADLLTQILTYHVVDGAVMSGDLSDGMTAASLDMGNELTFAVSDMGVMVNNANVVAADVAASNGVIHVIDTVLLPPVTLEDVIPADVQGDIITAGSSTVFPLTQAVAANFASEGYAGQITVDSIGSGAGLERFCVAGETDIANASRPINAEETEACEAIGRTPIEVRVGTDALAVVVNPANDFATDLTLEQLAVAFSTAETWADVDPSFPAEPILRFSPGTDSGTFDYFVEEVFDEDEAPILNASNLQLSEDDNVLLEGVANNEYAIGYFGYAYYAPNADALNIVNIEGVEANGANVDNNTYPLARPLFIYTAPSIIAEKPQVEQFVRYYLNTVNDTIGEVGYFPANEYALNAAKAFVLIANAQAMMEM
ncbi:MAG: hypothetical protein OHK0046_09190 [Anaerolineae bacterium]